MPKRKAKLPDCKGSDLAIDLFTGAKLYGFACPTHGLRYTMQQAPGQPMMIDDAEPVNGAKPPDPVGRGIQCDICADSMAYDGRYGRERTAPGEALADLKERADKQLEKLRKGGD